MALSLQNVSCGYTHQALLSGVNLTLGAGDFLCLLGPNGSGKTVLIRTLAGLLHPLAGYVQLDGKPLTEWSACEHARRLAYVPQAHAPLFAFRVLELVAMGRTARWPLWSGPSSADWIAAEKALDAVQMGDFADRRYTELSGGERQLVLIARALAQEASYLVLDEPASNLDFGNQVRVLQTLRRLAGQGLGVLMSTHHPEHALRCASQVAVLDKGRLEPASPPSISLTAAHLEAIYGVPFVVTEMLDSKGQPFPLCAPQMD